ncbi:hypothetical protein IAT40_005745 [Kwoniella sp. CBS 6097]
MLSFPCDYPDCDKRSVAIPKDMCIRCGKHHCVTHFVEPYHMCWTLDMKALLQLVKSSNIVTVASSMRENIPCTIEIPEDIYNHVQGGYNLLFPIHFEDGIRWLVRIRQQDNRPPLELMNRMIVESEGETLRILKEHGLIVPAVYVPPKKAVETSSISYLFLDIVDIVEGKPMDPPLHCGDDSEEKIAKAIYQLAHFLIQLSEITFPAVGGLYPSLDGSSNSIVGPLPDPTIRERNFRSSLARSKPISNDTLRKRTSS